jgi:hypothetical protein
LKLAIVLTFLLHRRFDGNRPASACPFQMGAEPCTLPARRLDLQPTVAHQEVMCNHKLHDGGD